VDFDYDGDLDKRSLIGYVFAVFGCTVGLMNVQLIDEGNSSQGGVC